MKISDRYGPETDITLYRGDCRRLLRQIPPCSAQLIVTSPPYNIGKEYEKKKGLKQYLRDQSAVIRLCIERLAEGGSICWQVGNHVIGSNEIVPLDIALYPLFARHGLKLRNRIVWHFGHGLHAFRRLSGRHETILWFTKGDSYVFNLDPIRIPQKYPGKKHFRGPNGGQYSGHVLGKNPGDVWYIPNVKHNHVEKTIHPCQFPVELAERLVLALTNRGDLVIDPYMGVATTAIAALRHGRRVAGAELCERYYLVGLERVRLLEEGLLRTRPMNRPIYEPPPNSPLTLRTDSPISSDSQ
jgi:adenine-specific DNA-methyltransferase